VGVDAGEAGVQQVPSPRGRLVRVAIRSHRRLFRDTLGICLAGQPEFTVVGHVADDVALFGLCDLCGPDLILYDAGADLGEALHALRRLRSRFGRIRLIVIYEHLSSADLAVSRQAPPGCPWRSGRSSR
jgi:two-component system, NarL family, nitrate/nitrite response regulator NarL